MPIRLNANGKLYFEEENERKRKKKQAQLTVTNSNPVDEVIEIAKKPYNTEDEAVSSFSSYSNKYVNSALNRAEEQKNKYKYNVITNNNNNNILYDKNSQSLAPSQGLYRKDELQNINLPSTKYSQSNKYELPTISSSAKKANSSYQAANKVFEQNVKSTDDYKNYETYAYNAVPILKRVKNQREVDNDNIGFIDKTVAPVYEGITNSLNNLFHKDREKYRLANGNEVNLTSKNDLKYQKTNDSYKTMAGRIFGGAMYSIGQQAPSMVAGLATGGVASALGATKAVSNVARTAGSLSTMFHQVSEDTNNRMLAQGYTKEQANQYAHMLGAIEVGTEVMFGGMGKLMGVGALDNVITNKLTKNIRNRVVKNLADAGISSVGEGIEEVMSDLLQPYAKQIALDDPRKYSEILKDENMLEDFLTGALSSAIMSAPSNVVSFKQDTKNRKKAYSYAPTKNTKINNLNKSASLYFDNTQDSHDLVNSASKFINDKNYNILFDDTITNEQGVSVNGLVRNLENGEVEIRLNPNSSRTGEFLMMHEVTHAIETQEMKDLVMDFASKNSEFNETLENLKQIYGTDDVSSEVLSDISGQLFGNQEFINSLSTQNTPQSRNIIKRVYESIKRLLNNFTEKGQYRNFVKDLETKWRDAYKNTTTEQAANNLNNDMKFSIQNYDGFGNVAQYDGIKYKTDNIKLQKSIKDYFDENFKNLEINTKTLDQGRKYTYPGKKQNLYNEVKAPAVTILDDVLKTMNNPKHEPDYKVNKPKKHTGLDTTGGFNHYDIKIGIPDNNGKVKIYEADGITRIDKNGKEYFYDLDKIKDTGQKVVDNLSKPITDSSVPFNKNSISQTKKNVNTTTKYSMQENENNAKQSREQRIKEIENMLNETEIEERMGKVAKVILKKGDKLRTLGRNRDGVLIIKPIKDTLDFISLRNESELKNTTEILKNKGYEVQEMQIEDALPITVEKYSGYKRELLEKELSILKQGYNSVKEYKQESKKQKERYIKQKKDLYENSFVYKKARKDLDKYNIAYEYDNRESTLYNPQVFIEMINRYAKNKLGAKEIYHSSKKNSKFDSSIYLSVDGYEVRISNHDLPQTAQRDYNHEKYGTRWDDELVLSQLDMEQISKLKTEDEFVDYLKELFKVENENNPQEPELDNSSFSLEQRVSGDVLLDAQDLIEEIKSVGAEVDENGYVTIYHQTTKENANKIRQSGKMIAKEPHVYFSTSPNASQSDGRGTEKLEFKVPAEKLLLDDIFSDNADVKIPLKGKNSLDISNYLVNTDYRGKDFDTASGRGITANEFLNKQENKLANNMKENKTVLKILEQVRNNPDAEIMIYRATPGDTINPGDWIFLSKEEADNWSKSPITKTLKPKFKVLEKKVKANEVDWSGKNLEFVYSPNNEKYSQNSTTWQEYLDNHYKPTGTRTNMQNIKLPQNKETNTKEVNVPVKKQPNVPVNPNKTLNPLEISKLTQEDANTTPRLPKVDYNKINDGESKFYHNIKDKTNMLNEQEKQHILSEDEVKYYDKITNKESLDKAFKRLNEGGKHATENWFGKDSTEADATDVAQGWILLKQYADNKDTDGMVAVAKKLRNIGTNAGQTVQAFNIIERMTPEGMVKYAQSELSEAYDKMVKNKSKQWIDKYKGNFDLKPEEVAFIMDTMEEVSKMEDGYEKRVKLGEIQKIMTDKLPPEKGAGIKAWMRISMLFNPKTQVRNVLGNAVIAPVNNFGDLMASIVDKQIAKKSGVRTTGTTNLKSYLKGFGTGLYQSYNDFKKGINTRNIEGNRFEIGQGKSFKEKTPIGKSLNKLDNLLSFMLDAGDRGFYEATFTNSINNQLVLNKTSKVTDDMIDIATQEALSRTWQDNNGYTKFVLQTRNGLNKINIKGYGLGDVLIPFAKTPANLTKAIVDYSPVGLVNTLIQGNNLRKSFSNGQFTPKMQHEFVQDLGKATAGTMLYVLGYALANAGISSGESDDDKDVKDFMKNTLGINSYSIKIGNKSFTYDWAQPIAAPISIMANMHQKNDLKASTLEKIVSSLDTAGNILLQQSFMESINTAVNNNDGLATGVQEAILDLPARAIPTLMKQIVDLTDDTQRQTFEYEQPLKTAINSMKAKVPGLSKELAPSVDTMGREIKRHGGKNGVFNVFFNPANVSTENISDSAAEIYRLYKETGDKTIMPKVAPYYIDKDEKIILSSHQRAEYNKTSGNLIEESVKKLLASKEYKNMSEEEKVNTVKNIVDYASNLAQKEVVGIEMAEKYQKAYEYSKIGDVSDYYSLKTATLNKKNEEKKKAVKDYLVNCNLNDSQIANLYGGYYSDGYKLNNILTLKIPMKEYIKLDVKNIEGDYNKKTGETIRYSARNKTINYINNLNLTIPQKAILIKSEYNTYDNYNSSIKEYVHKLNKNSEEEKLLLKSIGFDEYDKDVINYINKQNISSADKAEKLKKLGFKVRDGRVYS